MLHKSSGKWRPISKGILIIILSRNLDYIFSRKKTAQMELLGQSNYR